MEDKFARMSYAVCQTDSEIKNNQLQKLTPKKLIHEATLAKGNINERI